ncbi:MAG TPA: hypothetical protein VF701_00840 [Thermoanaerobaculia bacterium]
MRFGAEFLPALHDQKVGIARQTLGKLPLNGLRHPPEGSTCGWYIWAGEHLSQDADFFQPIHVSHLGDYCPETIPYLGLAPGWRFLLAPNYEDVWFDASLLAV